MMRELADGLGARFGCALLQLPPSFHARPHEEKSLRQFLRAWPDDLPLAVEFRDASWETPRAARLLEDHGVAWVWADTLPLDDQRHAGFGFLPVTAGHLYVRLLGDFRTKYGPDGRETHRYGRLRWPREMALEHWAVKIRHQTQAREIYLLANNHYEGMAVETVRRLAGKLGLERPAPAPAADGQLELFGEAPSG